MNSDDYMKALREKVLSDCPPDKTFWTCHGMAIRNIYELTSSIEGMNYESFNYHVNDEKNDFANWISEVLEDNELAHRLKKVRDKKSYVLIIKGRVQELESC